MSKKKKRKVPKSGAVWKMSAEEATLAKKPHYNGYACGHGVHGDVKYNRAKLKAQTRRILDEQGASRGSLPFEEGQVEPASNGSALNARSSNEYSLSDSSSNDSSSNESSSIKHSLSECSPSKYSPIKFLTSKFSFIKSALRKTSPDKPSQALLDSVGEYIDENYFKKADNLENAENSALFASVEDSVNFESEVDEFDEFGQEPSVACGSTLERLSPFNSESSKKRELIEVEDAVEFSAPLEAATTKDESSSVRIYSEPASPSQSAQTHAKKKSATQSAQATQKRHAQSAHTMQKRYAQPVHVKQKRAAQPSQAKRKRVAQPTRAKQKRHTLKSALPAKADWEQLLRGLDAGFSETLLELIDKSGKTDAEVYKSANVDRRLFSKIRNNANYKPSKQTALSFALALELSVEETEDFIGRAGYTLSHSSKFDVIVEYFLVNKIYNIFELNEVLYAFDQPLLGV